MTFGRTGTLGSRFVHDRWVRIANTLEYQERTVLRRQLQDLDLRMSLQLRDWQPTWAMSPDYIAQWVGR